MNRGAFGRPVSPAPLAILATIGRAPPALNDDAAHQLQVRVAAHLVVAQLVLAKWSRWEPPSPSAAGAGRGCVPQDQFESQAYPRELIERKHRHGTLLGRDEGRVPIGGVEGLFWCGVANELMRHRGRERIARAHRITRGRIDL